MAYDFSDQPANGGTWQWGSITESPKVTCEVVDISESYGTPKPGSPDHAWDKAIYPPGSRGSLRMTTKAGVMAATDQWRFSVDEYAKQFGAGDEFWLCWRTRMNEPYARHPFKKSDGGITGPQSWTNQYTDFKSVMIGYGMQYPYGPGYGTKRTAPWYGYQGPASNNTYNVLNYCQTDCLGEIVLISMTDQQTPGPGGWMKYPQMYVSKFFENLVSKGKNMNYYTHQNTGVEQTGVVVPATGTASKKCEFVNPGGGLGDQYTDYSTCFIYPTDEWFSLMIHVKLGPHGTAKSSLSGSVRTGYTDTTIEYYGAYQGQPWRHLHKRTGITLPTDDSRPGAEGIAKYGVFNWTTYTTAKFGGDLHPDAIVWVSQIILQPGPTMPAAPQ